MDQHAFSWRARVALLAVVVVVVFSKLFAAFFNRCCLHTLTFTGLGHSRTQDYVALSCSRAGLEHELFSVSSQKLSRPVHCKKKKRKMSSSNWHSVHLTSACGRAEPIGGNAAKWVQSWRHSDLERREHGHSYMQQLKNYIRVFLQNSWVICYSSHKHNGPVLRLFEGRVQFGSLLTHSQHWL